MKKIFTLFLLLMAVVAVAQPVHHITFNGTDQYMVIPHNDDFNIAADESFTFTGWVRNETYTTTPRYVCKRDMAATSGEPRTGYEFFGTGNAGQSLGLNTPTSTSGHALSVYTGVTVPAGEWMHFALVVDRPNNEIRIYHNGNTADAWSAPVNSWFVNNSLDVFVAAGNNGGEPTYFCNGSFGNVRFYDMALDAEEMLLDMNNSDLDELSATMRENLLAAYDFNASEVHDNRLDDLSGNNHEATLVNFSFGGAEILDVTLTQDTRLAGRGNANELLLKAAVNYGGDDASVSLQSMLLDLEGTTDLADVEEVKVYSTGTTNAFDWRTLEGATLIGTVDPVLGEMLCNLQGELVTGTNYLWVTAQLADEAAEGNAIDISLKTITTEDEVFDVPNASPEGSREIILTRSTVYRPGDYNSTNYRIPAVITAKDGSIVAVSDKRKYNDGDLPQDIDIVCNRSTDGGKTWSEPYTIAQGTGYNHGFGDCALAWSNDENGLIAGFVGGPGLWYSTPTNPIRSYISRSYDNGQTWSEPEDITRFIFGADCVVPEHQTWRASFFGSGNGLRTSTGRIIFVAAIREGAAQSLNNYAVYSDDNGQTWQVSSRASVGGDEAKVTELADGRILMSIRHAGNRWYTISNDGGETWQLNTSSWSDLVAPACNGDLIRYTSMNQGSDRNRLLHSLPYGSSRRDVTVYVSYDEGGTWPASKCIVPYSSAYSSLCILPDGSIGLYVEEEYPGEAGYSMVFYNFSLEWLTDGDDIFVPVSVAEHPAEVPAQEIRYRVVEGRICIEEPELRSVAVYNVKGQLLKSLTVNGASEVLVDQLSPGIYVIEAQRLDGSKKYGKIILGS